MPTTSLKKMSPRTIISLRKHFSAISLSDWDLKRQLFEWISGEGVSWVLHIRNPPEIMWAIAGTDERRTEFPALAQ
jgi:hypothetical protein